MAKNPFIAGLISLIPKAVETVSTLIKDKKERKEAEKANAPEPTTTAGAIIDSVKDAVSGSISQKRTLNLIGTGIIVSVALTDITARGITKLNLALICIGVVYSLGMTIMTWLSERK
jgi:hypothetical protein